MGTRGADAAKVRGSIPSRATHVHTRSTEARSVLPKHTGAPNECRCAVSVPWPFLLFAILMMIVCPKTLGNLGKFNS